MSQSRGIPPTKTFFLSARPSPPSSYSRAKTSPMTSTTSGELFPLPTPTQQRMARHFPCPRVSAPILPYRRNRPKNLRPSGKSGYRITPYTTQASAAPLPSSTPSSMMHGSVSSANPQHFTLTSSPPLFLNILNSSAQESMPSTPSTFQSSSKGFMPTP